MQRMKYFKFVLFLAGIVCMQVQTLEGKERWMKLNQTLNETYSYDSETIRLSKLDEFKDSLMEILKSKEDFPFDSIQNLVYFNTAEFRFFNWAFRFENGQMKYVGILENKKEKTILELEDISEDSPFAEDSIFTAPKWWGALYTQLIEKKINNKTYYTLLGWNSNNPFYHQKVIDVLSLKSNGEVIFGANIYKLHKKPQARVIFRYSRKTNMLLRYDYQAYTEIIKAKNKKKPPVLKQIPANLIIFERLICPQSHLEGEYAYYIPAGTVYDALFFDGKRWVLKLDVWARNEKTTTKRKARTTEPKLYDPNL